MTSYLYILGVSSSIEMQILGVHEVVQNSVDYSLFMVVHWRLERVATLM